MSYTPPTWTTLLSPLPAALASYFMFVAIDPEGGRMQIIPAIIVGLAGGSLSFVMALAALRRNRLNKESSGAGCAYVAIAIAILLLPEFFFMVAVYRVRTGSSRLQSLNHMKQIALALRSYAHHKGEFPPPAIYDKNGKTLLSWRVLMLPFFEEDSSVFHLDEPWDSPHNLRLLHTQIPPIFAPPEEVRTHQPWMTHYQIIVGPGAAFEEHKKIKLADFSDGLGNTLLLVEATEPVPWTKPEDVRYTPGQPLPKMGGLFHAGFNAAFADARVECLDHNLDPKTLLSLITRNANDNTKAQE